MWGLHWYTHLVNIHSTTLLLGRRKYQITKLHQNVLNLQVLIEHFMVNLQQRECLVSTIVRVWDGTTKLAYTAIQSNSLKHENSKVVWAHCFQNHYLNRYCQTMKMVDLEHLICNKQPGTWKSEISPTNAQWNIKCKCSAKVTKITMTHGLHPKGWSIEKWIYCD